MKQVENLVSQISEYQGQIDELDSQIEELDEYTMKGLLNARPDINANIKAMQTIG